MLSTHYEAMKKKSGYRSDLLEDIDTPTSAPVGRRSDTRDKLSEQCRLSKSTVARYLRVNKLIPALKDRLDNNDISMRAAEALSFMRPDEQEIVESLLADGMKINIKQAVELKAASENGKLTRVRIEYIINPDC